VSDPPFAPQVYGFGVGGPFPLESGEMLYNANEVPPHAALKLIESVVRLSAKKDEMGLDAGGGKEARWDDDKDDEEDPQTPPQPRRPPSFDKSRKLNWNGPSAGGLVGGGVGGGGEGGINLIGG